MQLFFQHTWNYNSDVRLFFRTQKTTISILLSINKKGLISNWQRYREMHKKCRTAYENCGLVKKQNSLLPNRYHHLMINHSELTLKLWVGVNANMEIKAEALSRKTSTLTAYEQWIQPSFTNTFMQLDTFNEKQQANKTRENRNEQRIGN